MSSYVLHKAHGLFLYPSAAFSAIHRSYCFRPGRSMSGVVNRRELSPLLDRKTQNAPVSEIDGCMRSRTCGFAPCGYPHFDNTPGPTRRRMKRQLASRNQLAGILWCKFGHVTPRNPAPKKPSCSTEWLAKMRTVEADRLAGRNAHDCTWCPPPLFPQTSVRWCTAPPAESPPPPPPTAHPLSTCQITHVALSSILRGPTSRENALRETGQDSYIVHHQVFFSIRRFTYIVC